MMNNKKNNELMTREEFDACILRILQEELEADGVELQLHKSVKNNGVEFGGLLFSKKGINLAPAIYLDAFYEEYRQYTDIKEILVRIKLMYDSVAGEENFVINLDSFRNLSNVICYKLVNMEKNKEFLKGVPHRKFYDLAVIYYIHMEYQGESLSYTITKENLDHWNVTEEDVFQCADRNTSRMFPIKMISLGSIMKILTNVKKAWGAVSILYSNVYEKLAEIDDNCYLVPSSIHEWIVIPKSLGLCAQELKNLVQEMNTEEIAAEEILGDSVYFYDKELNSIYMLQI